jgi:hypothetical protein
MRSFGNLTKLVLVSVVALAAQRADAVPLHQKQATATPLVHLAGRKGTRNYVPGESGALTVPSDTEAAPERDSLEECMAIWDAGTHITKRKWREICKRQLKERADLRSDALAQPKP